MKTKDIQELYKIKLHSMDTILHQISLMDQVENEQELSEIIHSLLQAIGNYTGADRVYVFDWETDQKDSLSNTFEWCADGVIPEIDNLQAIPVSLMPSWMKRFENKETIVIHDLESTKCSEPEEYELLKMLMQNSGIVLQRGQILDRVWGIDYEGESRTLDMHIKTLRKKMGDKGALVQTVRNVGYTLNYRKDR